MSGITKIIKSKDYGVEENKFDEMQKGLQLTLSERELLREEFDVVSKLEVTEENKPKFRSLRLKWAKNRTVGVNDWHKKGKAVSLAIGKLYDARKNELNTEGEANEKVLLDAENHLENLKKERLKALQLKRAELLSEFLEDAHERVLSGMEEDVWLMYLASKKKIHLDFIKAELDNEKERQRLIDEEIAEKSRIESENSRLKIERDKIKNELEARKQEELDLIESKRLAVQSELSKGDSERVVDLIDALNDIKTKFTFESEANIKMFKDVSVLLDRVVVFIEK